MRRLAAHAGELEDAAVDDREARAALGLEQHQVLPADQVEAALAPPPAREGLDCKSLELLGEGWISREQIERPGGVQVLEEAALAPGEQWLHHRGDRVAPDRPREDQERRGRDEPGDAGVPAGDGAVATGVVRSDLALLGERAAERAAEALERARPGRGREPEDGCARAEVERLDCRRGERERRGAREAAREGGRGAPGQPVEQGYRRPR